MLSKSIIERVLLAALSEGGDFSEVYLENTRSTGISALNGLIERASSGIDYGIGIRILSGDKSVYVYSNDLDENLLVKLARDASASLSAIPKGISVSLRPIINYKSNTAIINPVSYDKSLKADVLKRACNAAKNYNELITQTGSSCSDIEKSIIIANSEGGYVTDHRIRTRFTIEAVASYGEEKQTGFFGPGAGTGYEFIQNLPVEEISREAARIAVTMIYAKPCPSGKMPVVIGNGFGGVIFHEACGHSLEATSVGIKASVFTGKIGTQIASELVTAIDNPTIANEWGSFSIDDEGVTPQKHLLIENGILKEYLVDRLGSRRMERPENGCGRRQNYQYQPTSRMSNTFIAPGKSSHEDIIAETDYGIYAASMGGGSVDPATGEFNFAVNEAYMIRGGKIAEPVRGATLIGKGSEILLNIDRVGNNIKLAQGMCGSVSGNVPVNVGQPTIRVSNITVGGNE